MAELIEYGLSFTEQRPDGSHKLGKRAVIIGAGIGGLATAGAAGFAAVRALYNLIRARGELQ